MSGMFLLAMVFFYAASLAADNPPSSLSSLPRAPAELQKRWKAMRAQGPAESVQIPSIPTAIQDAVLMSAESGAMVEDDPFFRQSYWCAIDLLIKSAKPAELLPLRELQERKTKALAREIRRKGGAAEAVNLFRRYPWAHSTHELLIEFAEDALRNGHNNWAARSFEDVLTHADDPAVLAEAHVGLWFTLAGMAGWHDELERAMSAVTDDTMLPWKGGLAKAAEIKAVIRTPTPPASVAPATPLADIKRVKIQLPAALAAVAPVMPNRQVAVSGLGIWIIRRIETTDDLLVVIGSRHVACYSSDTTKLLPLCGTHLSSNPSWVEPVWRPAILGQSWSTSIGGRNGGSSGYPPVYSMEIDSRAATLEYSVAAWNTGSGRMLWNTGGRPEWEELLLQSEPVAGEGCLYVLATGRSGAKGFPIYLICMDSGSGNILWQRLLGTLSIDNYRRSTILTSGAITLHQGSLYVSTDLGIAARCDARDGTLDWARTYPSCLADERAILQYGRDGTAPLVTAGRALIAPRDHTGVIALEPVSGRLLWENTLTPSDRIVGVSGNVLITQGAAALAGLNPATGACLWTKALDEMKAPRAIVTGEHILVTAGDRLTRLLASTGAAVDELHLTGGPGAAFAPLADGSIAEFTEEPVPDPAVKTGTIAGPLKLPLAGYWSLPCERPLLVLRPAGSSGTNTLAVLSDRLLFCIDPQRGHIVWQSRLPISPDSAGFHGRLVLTARDHAITALNAASGTTEWMLHLSFSADITGGDDRVLFAGDMTKAGTVAAIDPATGKLLWQKSFGDDSRLAGGQLEWIRIRGEAPEQPSLTLYWNSASFGGDGNRPAEVIIDATTGAIREVKRFLPGEPRWPAQIAFNDSRTYASLRRLPPWSSRGLFLPESLAYIGDGDRAHFMRLENGQELPTGLNLIMNVRPQAQYWSSVGLHPAADGAFVRRTGQLVAVDASNPTSIVYELPKDIAGRAAFNILDFQADATTVMTVSGAAGAIPEVAGDECHPYQWEALQDCTGKGSVSMECFRPIIQTGHSTLQLQEAGVNPAATLLNGQTRQHYQDSRIRMSNISSLGWTKYDVYLYGFTGTATVDRVSTQICASADWSRIADRTTFMPGVNYVRFPDLTGNSFTLDISQSPFSAVQIVNTSPGAVKEKPEGLGINWTGGGPAIRETDIVGAVTACNNWYNINEYDEISGGMTNAQSVRASMSMDVFDRVTGRLIGTQNLPGARIRAQKAGYTGQARLFNNGLLTTDANGVYFLRSAVEP